MGAIGVGCGFGVGGATTSLIGMGLLSIGLFLSSSGIVIGGTVSSLGLGMAGRELYCSHARF